jgi:hypothetical protein
MRSSTRASVPGSSALVGSSSSSSELPFAASTPRARHRRWRWPPERLKPRSDSGESRLLVVGLQHLVESAGVQGRLDARVAAGPAEAQVLAHAGLEHLGLLRDQRGDLAAGGPIRKAAHRRPSAPVCGA